MPTLWESIRHRILFGIRAAGSVLFILEPESSLLGDRSSWVLLGAIPDTVAHRPVPSLALIPHSQ